MKKLMVKRNINTLDKPMWTPSRKWAGQFEFEDGKGYILKSGLGLPTEKDMEILNHLLALSQQSGEDTLTFDSMYSLLEELGYDASQSEYERVAKSLAKWGEITLMFTKGSFYEKGKKMPSFTIMSILNFVNVEKGKIQIEFNKHFLKMNESSFARYISIDFMKSIESPYAKRLYEILCKSFEGREAWAIGDTNLALKMMVYYRYPNELHKIVMRSMEEINVRLEQSGSTIRYYMEHEDEVFTFIKEE